MSAILLVQDFSLLDSLGSGNRRTSFLNKLSAVHAVMKVGRGQIKKSLDQQARIYGVEWHTVHRWVKDYKAGGEAALVDHRKAPKGFQVPHAAVSWVHGIYHKHQRANDVAREVYRTVKAQYEKWVATGNPTWAIPGYDMPPPRSCSVSGDPEGLSYKTIVRMMPEEIARKLTTRGAKEASSCLPPILTTRVGSRVLSRIVYDDQEYDTLVQGGLMLTGLPSASRPVGFNSLDFYTAVHLDHIIRYRFTEEDEKGKKTKRTLTGKDFTWFVIAGLQKHGYRKDELGTKLVMEHGTANAWSNDKLQTLGGLHSFGDAIYAVTNKCACIDQSGLFNTPMFADMYFRPQSTGNFKYKTWIESAFRLVRTYMQALPGPTGLSYQTAPEELYGIQKREEQLLKALTKLSPYHASLLRRHLMTFAEFGNLVMNIYHAINARSDHHLEGWAACGFTIPAWREEPTSTKWHTNEDLAHLTEVQRSIILSKISQDPRLTTELNFSPTQAYEQELKRDARCIAKLHDQHVAYLVPTDWAQQLTVKKNHTIEVSRGLGQDPLPFVAQTRDGIGRTTFLAGQDLLCYWNPFIPDKLIIHDCAGNYRGTLWQNTAAEAWNYDRTLEQFEVRSQLKHDLTLQTRDELRDVAATRTANERHNDRIIRDQTPETDALDRIAKRAAKQDVKAAEHLQDELESALHNIRYEE